jgi:lipoprotein NlpI
LRGNYNTALEYIDKCLEIDPDHEAARHDKKLILERIGKG